VWTLISSGVAGAAVAVILPLAMGDDEEPPPGIVITPP
jgi:hypothetical protein